MRMCDQARLRKPWVGQLFHSSYDSRSRGTAMLLHKHLQFSLEQFISDSNGRYTIVVGTLLQTPVIMVCEYAPTWDCPNFLTTLFSLIPCLDTHHLIFGGDLNLTISPSLDKSNPKALTSSNMARALITLTNQIDCVDAWRFRHPTTKEFSFYSTVHRTYSRIDFYFLDRILLSSMKLCE